MRAIAPVLQEAAFNQAPSVQMQACLNRLINASSKCNCNLSYNSVRHKLMGYWC